MDTSHPLLKWAGPGKQAVSSRSVLYSSLMMGLLIWSSSFGPSLFYLLHRLWLLGGVVRQGVWDALLDRVGENQYTLWVVGTSTILIVQYWVLGAFYTFLDMTLSPESLRKFKVQPGMNEPLLPNQLRNIVSQVLFNQIVVGLPSIAFGAAVFMLRGPPDLRPLPAFHWVLLQVVYLFFAWEVVYYYIHRILHNKHLYQLVHKRHHEWTSPVAVSAIYCHPIEQVSANLFPPFFGLFVINAHLSVCWLWFSIAVFFTLTTHSGYKFPFMEWPQNHDFHHYSFISNYGVLGILDHLHGTDAPYKRLKKNPRTFIRKTNNTTQEISENLKSR